MFREARLNLASNCTHSWIVRFQLAFRIKEYCISERALNGCKQARNILEFDYLIRLSKNKSYDLTKIWGITVANYRVKITTTVRKNGQPRASPLAAF